MTEQQRRILTLSVKPGAQASFAGRMGQSFTSSLCRVFATAKGYVAEPVLGRRAMAWPLRNEYPGAMYHVTLGGVEW